MTRSPYAAAGSITLIVEPNPNGHRLYYVDLLVEYCRSLGHKVIVYTTQNAIESPQWRVHLADRAPEIVIGSESLFAFDHIGRVANDVRASLSIVSDGDRYLLPVLRGGWKGPGEVSLLVMRADGQDAPPAARAVKGLTKKTIAWAAGLRPNVRVSALRSPLVSRRGPLRWAPDPVTLRCKTDDIRQMRGILERHGNLYWFGVFGAITPRKNLPLIIQALLHHQDVGLMIAGSIDPQVSDEIAPLMDAFTSRGGRVIQLSKTLSDAEFDGAISAVNCVIAAHSNEGPSGVVLKAAASGRRLILVGAKSLRNDAKNLGTQATWTPLNVDELARAIYRVKNLPEPDVAIDVGTQGFLSSLA